MIEDAPRTLLPVPGLRQPLVFDPALKQYPRAFRAGEPRFPAGPEELRWRRSRRTALDLVLAAVAAGPYADRLVLRGSVLLATWFPDAAREPGDLDFVVPAQRRLDIAQSTELLAAVAQNADGTEAGGVRIDGAGAQFDDIWTYDRVPGQRLVLPWTATSSPGGTVQVDLVLAEQLPVPVMPTLLRPLGDGPATRIQVASPDLSLAWKLLWLLNDAYPQGKDLYDAVLLAEHVPLTYELAQAVLLAPDGEGSAPLNRDCLSGFDEQEWQHFMTDYPRVNGNAADHARRLLRGLDPLFAESARAVSESEYDRWTRWLAPVIARARAAAPGAGATTAEVQDAVAAAMSWWGHGKAGLLAAVVVARELIGPGRVDLHAACDLLLAPCRQSEDDPRRALWRGNQALVGEVLAELR
jgi:hypothetical protein